MSRRITAPKRDVGFRAFRVVLRIVYFALLRTVVRSQDDGI